MKKIICVLILIFGLFSCNNRSSEKKADKDTIETTDSLKQDIFIKNKSQYSKSFVEGLSGYKQPIKLLENYMLVGQDTVYFPEDLQLGNETVFSGNKDKKNFLLTVTRMNLTTLKYNFRLLDKDAKLLNSKEGEATLSPMFFLGSETDDDDKTGDEYLSVEYWDNSNDCSFAIRIGDKDSSGKLRAKIKHSCKDDESKNIGLYDNPTLRTE